MMNNMKKLMVVLLTVALLLKLLHWYAHRKDDELISGTIAGALILCLALSGAGIPAQAKAEAEAGAIDFTDYNDYVQTVYAGSSFSTVTGSASFLPLPVRQRISFITA